MKKSKFGLGALALFALLIWGLAPAARADDKQVLTRIEHQMAAATTADEAMKFYDSSDDIVLFDMMGPPREFTGHQAIHDHFAQLFVGYKDLKVDFLKLKVISDGKLALARSVQRFTAKGPDSQPVDITFRQTDLFRKTHGQWKVIDQHISVPVDMKTGKADMTSKM